jgi:hypothetical protein
MPFRRPVLGSNGKKQRIACARELASMLITQLANGTPDESHKAIVTNKSHLEAFRDLPSGKSVDQQLTELRGRVRRQLRSAGYEVAFIIDSEVRAGKVYHFSIEAIPVPPTVRVAAR